jgi:hypothetical protein
MPHGKGSGHDKETDVGSVAPHDKESGRTVASARTPKIWAHDSAMDARQSLCRATFMMCTTKMSLLSKNLLCDLCRAASHGKVFAVRIEPFAVRIVARQHPSFP